MERHCFNLLCKKIEKAVGKKKLKSEQYINNLKEQGTSTPESRMYVAHRATCGDYIPGEVKLAITLQILAGASYLDIFLWFNLCPNHGRKISREVMRTWICNDDVIMINYYKNVLHDATKSMDIARHFSEKSNGIINGVIGALDGWLI